MSSNIFVFDEPLYNFHPLQQQCLNPIAMLNSDTLFHSDSSIDIILQEPNTVPKTEAYTNLARISANEAQSLDQIAQTLLSDSSPVDQMESLSLHQQTNFTHLQSFSQCPVSDIKTEEPQTQMGFESTPSSEAYFSGSHSYGGSGGESLMIRFLQRSYSYGAGGDSYDGEKQGTLFQPAFGALYESPENGFSIGHSSGLMRRVSSTGDLPKLMSNPTATSQRVGSSLLGSENNTTPFMEEANFKVGRYSAEERKERIDRYKAKRTQRNFNKTIKYACRKTLAENRLRVRGRFARNDEPGQTPKSAGWFKRYDDEDDLWTDCLHEGGDNEEKMNGYAYGVDGDQRGHFLQHFGGSSSKFDEYSIIEY